MASIGSGEYPVLPAIKIPLPLGNELPTPVVKGGISINQNWDKNGNIFYTDENGNRVNGNIGLLEKLKRKAQATAFNVNDWLNEQNPEHENYKQRATAAVGLVTAPLGLGEAATAGLARVAVPFLGKKLATMTAQGIGGGLVGGGAEGFTRGLLHNENPFVTGAQDAAIGGLLGGALGLGIGKIGQKMALNNIRNNIDDTLRQQQYFDNYIEGLNNAAVSKQGLSINDIRALKIGDYGQKGRGLEYNFIGENAFNTPKGKLMEAKQMAMYGDSNADIRNATGWFKGVDGKWRYEIPDGKMIDNPKLVENFDEDIGTYYTGKLSDIYDAPELYQAYPQLANRDIVIQSMPEGYGGSSWGDSISINRNYFQKDNPEFLKLKAELENTPEYKKYDLAFNTDTGDAVQDLANMDKAQKEFFDSDIGKQYYSLMWDKNYPIERKVQGFNDDALKTLVHETQHQIQGIEGFARGGSGENPDYWNLAGEVEARLAGARAKLTPEQRQIYNPANESSYLSNYGYDVVPEKQIVEFRNNESDLYNNLVNNNEIVKPPLKYRDKSVIMDGVNYPELDLPKEEYAPLHSAFVRHIADAPKGTKIIVKPYGGYVYTAIIEDDLPRFIDKDYH